jgi:hypothetical protein
MTLVEAASELVTLIERQAYRDTLLAAGIASLINGGNQRAIERLQAEFTKPFYPETEAAPVPDVDDFDRFKRLLDGFS